MCWHFTAKALGICKAEKTLTPWSHILLQRMFWSFVKGFGNLFFLSFYFLMSLLKFEFLDSAFSFNFLQNVRNYCMYGKKLTWYKKLDQFRVTVFYCNSGTLLHYHLNSKTVGCMNLFGAWVETLREDIPKHSQVGFGSCTTDCLLQV